MKPEYETQLHEQMPEPAQEHRPAITQIRPPQNYEASSYRGFKTNLGWDGAFNQMRGFVVGKGCYEPTMSTSPAGNITRIKTC